ncbi:hypothetical protein FRC17_006258 [Serendipita sp. 399]|nr:hypothetical protein FRC17_006258 [Serendipita sp. 399]
MNRISSVVFHIQTAEAHEPIQFSLAKAAAVAAYPHVLVLDSLILLKETWWLEEALLSSTPSGPCRYTVSSPDASSRPKLDGSRIRLYLTPLFVQKDQVQYALHGLPTGDHFWLTLSARLGGSNLVISPAESRPMSMDSLFSASCPRIDLSGVSEISFTSTMEISFLVFTNELELLHLFSDTLCTLIRKGGSVRIILVAKKEPGEREVKWTMTSRCYLGYSIEPISSLFSLATSGSFDIAFLLDDDEAGTHRYSVWQPPGTTLLRLNRQDTVHSMWMTALSATEWKGVVPKPSTALYWGHEQVNVMINMEQTADAETRKIVEGFKWKRGLLTVRHRVVLGGLIPAIVESWYPTDNDAYGLILEDDVELSPFFIAWVKMSILRYRYGTSAGSRHLYGLSLYSPKNVELRPLGRQPWSAQALFEDMELPFKATPYLSATPCSWGAVYFPEPWREFHHYLISRQSEEIVPVDTIIVPDVRSNRWKKSWKRFFIEFAWLKGLVMLYPNFDNFVSFSTNHLEIGSHVSDASAKARKKALFVVPLMTLEDGMSAFLQLPNGELPMFEDLPVVDLHGQLSSLEELEIKGRDKMLELCAVRSRSRGTTYSVSWCKYRSIVSN